MKVREQKHRSLYKDTIHQSIDKLHRVGIYHLDIHCGNIVADFSGDVRMIDYGASVFIHEIGPEEIRRILDRLGTVEDLLLYEHERFDRVVSVLDDDDDTYSGTEALSSNS